MMFNDRYYCLGCGIEAAIMPEADLLNCTLIEDEEFVCGRCQAAKALCQTHSDCPGGGCETCPAVGELAPV